MDSWIPNGDDLSEAQYKKLATAIEDASSCVNKAKIITQFTLYNQSPIDYLKGVAETGIHCHQKFITELNTIENLHKRKKTKPIDN